MVSRPTASWNTTIAVANSRPSSWAIAAWFAASRGIAVPRAMRLLAAELAKGSSTSPDPDVVNVK